MTVVASLEEALRDPHFVARGLFSRKAGRGGAGPAAADRAGVSREAKTQKLNRFAAHQFRHRRRRRHAFAHHRAAQRADAVDHVKPEPARALHREENPTAGCG